MIDYAISTKHGIEIVTGYKIGKQYATHKACKNNWIVTDLASGLLVFKNIETSSEAIKMTKNMSEEISNKIEAIRQTEGYKKYVKEIDAWKADNLPDQLYY